MNIRDLVTLCVIAFVTVISINAHAQDSRTYIDGRSEADGDVPPYSGAVLVGDTLYLSGTLGLDENREVPDDPADEVRNAMNVIKRKCRGGRHEPWTISCPSQVFCSDVAYYQAFNDVYRTYFTREYPARAFIGVGYLVVQRTF